MKVMITGVAGTGKSTISEELNKRGIYSIDFSDVPGLCFWQDVNTGEKVDYVPINDPGWFNTKDRFCDKDKLKEIVSEKEDIVVTGVASGNQADLFELFDKVLLLQCNSETFVERMINRDKVYGKTKTERDDIVEWQKTFDPEMIQAGAIPVSTEGAIEETIEKVISLIELKYE